MKARELPVTLIPSNESTSPEEDASQVQVSNKNIASMKRDPLYVNITTYGIFFKGAKQVSGVGEDLFENPLKCPLDLGHLAFQPSGDLGFRCVLDKGFVSPDMKVSQFTSPPNVFVMHILIFVSAKCYRDQRKSINKFLSSL